MGCTGYTSQEQVADSATQSNTEALRAPLLVNIAGTPKVSIDGTPQVEIASGSVDITSGNVNVTAYGGDTSIARPQHYDRNGASKAFSGTTYNMNAVNLWSYTVPVGKKAKVELIQVIVSGQATNTGQTGSAYITVTPKNGSEQTILTVGNRIGSTYTSSIPVPDATLQASGIDLFAGDVLKGYGNSTQTYPLICSANAKLTEFDA